jgi:hypothetical protein
MAARKRRAGPAVPANTRRGDRRAVVFTLAIGLLVLAVGVAVALSASSARRIATNGVVARSAAGTLSGSGTICELGERIPAGTGAIRISLGRNAHPQPAMRVVVAGGATRAVGNGDVSWGSQLTTAAIHPTVRQAATGSVCVVLQARQADASARMLIEPAEAAEGARVDGQQIPGRLHVEYLRPEPRSWWSFASTVVDRIGRGHAWSGASVALLAVLLTLTSILLASWQLVRSAR